MASESIPESHYGIAPQVDGWTRWGKVPSYLFIVVTSKACVLYLVSEPPRTSSEMKTEERNFHELDKECVSFKAYNFSPTQLPGFRVHRDFLLTGHLTL